MGVGTCGIKADVLGSGPSFHSFCWSAGIAVSKRIIPTLFYTPGSGDATCSQFCATQLESGPQSHNEGKYFSPEPPPGTLGGSEILWGEWTMRRSDLVRNPGKGKTVRTSQIVFGERQHLLRVLDSVERSALPAPRLDQERRVIEQLIHART